MKTFRIFAVIFGLAALLLTQPGMRASFSRAFGGSERDKAARCLVVSKYLNLETGDRLRAAASDRLQDLLGNELQECVEARTGGLRAPSRVVNACLNYVHRFEEAANLEAFPDGDSSNMSTIRKWAGSDYCNKLMAEYRPPSAPASATPESPIESTGSAPADAPPAPTESVPSAPSTEPSSAPSGWQMVQQQIASNPEGYVRGCMERYLESAQQLGGMSREEALQQQPNLEGQCRQELVDLQNCMTLDPVASERCYDAFTQNAE